MRHTTVAVIGHIDHGKTSLVKALTGIETDTLKAEKARGLSIELGFAHLRQSDRYVHLIDTPGHADFVRMTASGVSGADKVLLVVSAVDGIQPQTRDHIRIARLFGISSAIVAITKSDLVGAKSVDQLRQDVSNFLAENNFELVAIEACSSSTNEGVSALASALFERSQSLSLTPDLKGFFLPIDRVFSVSGVGTVVTGTLRGQALHTGQVVAIGPDGFEAHIRGLQVCGVPQEMAAIGARVAVNLRDVDLNQISRGHVLRTPDLYPASDRFDVAFSNDPPLKHMEQVILLHGTAHAPARVRLYPTPGHTSRFGQIEASTKQTAYPGQRFVLRRPASGETIAGGTILDPNATLITRNKPAHVTLLGAIKSGAPSAIAHALAARDKGAVDVSVLDRVSDLNSVLIDSAFEQTPTGSIFRRTEIQAVESKLQSLLESHHTDRPLRPSIPIEEIKTVMRPTSEDLLAHALHRLSETGRVRREKSGFALPQHDPIAAMTEDQKRAHQMLETRLRNMALRPATLFENPSRDQTDSIALLIWQGRAVALYNHSLKQTLLLHQDVIKTAQRSLKAEYGDGTLFTTGQARALLETNRKTIVPLLEHFDQVGVTVRSGDKRAVRI
ncbi:MAG: selenocysteine-specific translation elongation factor [Pseudomonadota bacterium]